MFDTVTLRLQCAEPFGPSGFVDLHSKRDELNCHISLDEKEKERLQHDIQVLSGRLCSVTQSLAQRLASRDAFDITITEAKAAYTNVCFCLTSIIMCSSLFFYQRYFSVLRFFLLLFQSHVYCNIVNLLLLKVNSEPARTIRYFHWYESLI